MLGDAVFVDLLNGVLPRLSGFWLAVQEHPNLRTVVLSGYRIPDGRCPRGR